MSRLVMEPSEACKVRDGIRMMQMHQDPMIKAIAVLLHSRTNSFMNNNGVRIQSYEGKIDALIKRTVEFEGEGEDAVPKTIEVEKETPQGEGQPPLIFKMTEFVFKSEADKEKYEKEKKKLDALIEVEF